MTEKLETPTLAEVIDAFHTLFPPQLAAGWDASGLVAGRGAAKVSTVLFAVDALTATAEEAVAEGAQLLITHHPLLLRGAKFIPDSDYKGNILHTLIEGGCGLLGAHTNADAAVEGVNEALCEAIGLIDCEPLTEAQTQVLDEQEHTVGTGRLGTLPEEITLKELAERLAAVLPATCASPDVPTSRSAASPSAAVPVTLSSAPCAPPTRRCTSPPTCATTPPVNSVKLHELTAATSL